MLALSARLGRLLRLSDQLGTAELSKAFFDGLASGHEISASLVCDKAGSFVGSIGTSDGLGGETDRLWLGALRRQTQLVLTSGLTFRTERYKMPKVPDLAVLTRQGVDRSSLEVQDHQRLHVLSNEASYSTALSSVLDLGYSKVHVEFGPTGIRELMANVKLTLWISSPAEEGLFAGAKALGLEQTPVAQVGGLWLGKATSAAWQRL